MSVNEMLMAAAGNAGEATYVEDVFSTWLYTGNGSTQTITNGIDLAGEGGLVWTKDRTGTESHDLEDTVRGAGKLLYSNLTNAQATNANAITSFNSNGYSFGSEGQVNRSGSNFASWTFRKAPKFFDVVTYTGNGVAGRTVAHNLGSTPGMVIVKNTSDTSNWFVWHRSLASSFQQIRLNTNEAANSTDDNLVVTSSNLEVYTTANTNGKTYVAYLFAHDAGGFGAAGTDNIISCGSFSTDSGTFSVNLGYEPQFLMIKRSDSTGNWILVDTMRGFPAFTNGITSARLLANTSGAETQNDVMSVTSTGFESPPGGYGASQTYIYMAIRRPMKTPTTGTSVFSPVALTPTLGQKQTLAYPSDLTISRWRGSTGNSFWLEDRMRGYELTNSTTAKLLQTHTTSAETTSGNSPRVYNVVNDGYNYGDGLATVSSIFYNFRRASGFFDIVCYTGTGSATTFNHNLGVTPELMIVKNRSNANSWAVYSKTLLASQTVFLNETASVSSEPNFWNSTRPDSTVFTVGSDDKVNGSGRTYIAYLFATVAGVSKVGSYTGNGSNQTIDCGFTTGARFVLIKSTSANGNWVVLDTARGIVSGSDPFLQLNSTLPEVTNEDIVDPANSGFIVNSTTEAINTNGVTYIFLAIA